MMELPPDHELISIFESEPEFDDETYTWHGGGATFRLIRGRDVLTAYIEAGFERVRLKWTRDEEELLFLELGGVVRIESEIAPNHEALILKFMEDIRLRDLRVRTRPTIHFAGRTEGAIV